MTIDPDAPWFINELVIVIWTILISTGGIITAVVSARKARASAMNDVDQQLQRLIDQVQEERNKAVEAAEADRAMYQAQIDKLNKATDRFWADKNYSRQHVAALEDHIWKRKDPPPPPPPAGYIP